MMRRKIRCMKGAERAMNILQIVAAGVLCAVLALTVKKQSPETALMITIAASILIFMMVLPQFTEAMGVLTRVGELLDGGLPYVALVIKVTGVAYIAELGASVCLDAGESAIATKIEMAGRVMILILAVPVIVDLVNLIMGLLP
jgi:stage III sporulation protein AD